jgi:hypothetical protein
MRSLTGAIKMVDSVTVRYQQTRLVIGKSAVLPPNYAMKATTVEELALNLATGPVAPYFGC